MILSLPFPTAWNSFRVILILFCNFYTFLSYFLSKLPILYIHWMPSTYIVALQFQNEILIVRINFHTFFKCFQGFKMIQLRILFFTLVTCLGMKGKISTLKIN